MDSRAVCTKFSVVWRLQYTAIASLAIPFVEVNTTLGYFAIVREQGNPPGDIVSVVSG
jgi:hypothetical protein